MTGERFIPFRKTSIVTMCADETPAADRESFRAFAELLASLLHHEFRSRLEALKDTYYPFNPDTGTRTIGELDPSERQAAQKRLVDGLTALAEDANFERIDTDDLDRAFVEESLMKVRLEADFDDFEQVVFYRRGEHTRQEEVKHLFGLRRRTIEFTTYGKVRRTSTSATSTTTRACSTTCWMRPRRKRSRRQCSPTTSCAPPSGR